jgi:ABC-type glycerol-3-phosphate transport system substrate-binding protein
MKRFQHIVSLILLLTLSPAACTTPAPTPTIEVDAVAITFACMDYQRDYYQDLAGEFGKLHPAIAVELVSVDEVTGNPPNVGSSDDIYKVAAAADAFVDFAGMLGDAPQDIVLDLTALIEQDEKFTLDDFFPGPLALFQSGGKLWGLPFTADTRFIYYNPKLFDAADVPHPEIGWSWDDFLQAASRLTIREGDTVEQYGYMDPYPFYTLSLLAHQKAGPLIDDAQDPPLARLDVPGVAEAVQWYADLILVHGVMPNPATMDSLALQQFAYEQSPAMWVGGSYERDNFVHLYKAGVVPLPEAGQAATIVSADGYFISAGTARPKKAWRWIEFLSRQPPSRYDDSIPARRSVAEETRYWKKMNQETAAVYQYALGHAVNYPGAIQGRLRDAFEAVLEGEPVEVALAAAQERANEKLAQAAAEAQRPPKELAVATPVPTPTPGGTLIRFTVSAGTDPTPFYTLAERFHEAQPEVAVEVSPGGGYSLAEQAAEADCFAWYAHGLPPEASDALLALDPLMADDETFRLDVFAPAFLEPVRAEGVLWGLPLETDAWLLYYNRGLFDAVGASYPPLSLGREGWTPQELVEQAIALTELSTPEPTYGFYPRDGAYANTAYYVAWLGGQLFDADGQPTFDDPTVAEALSHYADLIVKASPPSAAERGEDRWPTHTMWWGGHPGLVGLGRVAMWVDYYDNHRGAPALDFDVGVAPLPAGAAPLTAYSPQALFISAQTPHPNACWDWIAFLSAQPEAVSRLPLRYDIAASDAWRDQVGAETADAWQAFLDRGESPQRPWTQMPNYFALYWLDEALVDALAGARPAAALAEAQVKAAAFAGCMASGGATEEAMYTCARQADPDVVLPGE